MREETNRNHVTALFAGVLLAVAFALAQGPATAQKKNAPVPASELPIHLIKMPPGFEISIYADSVPGARSMALGEDGALFVGTRKKSLYAVVDTNNDHKADKTYIIADDLAMPNGVAFRDGKLYVMEARRLIRYDGIEARLDHPPAPVVLSEAFPEQKPHAWKYLAFGPDGKIYFNIGSPGDTVNMEAEDERFATISRINADGSDPETYVRGVRQSVGIAWHPETKELWFTDNGRDNMGDDRPPCELNKADRAGLHFGHPFCLGGELLDPVHGQGRGCDEFVAPVQKLDPHVTPLGLKFYTGNMFPKVYKNQIFIAEHGSAKRGIPSGYRVSIVRFDENNTPHYEAFADGWAQRLKTWGRPVDVLVMPDGALLVSDDKNGVIYRIAYKGRP